MAGTEQEWRSMRLLRGVDDSIYRTLMQQGRVKTLAVGDLLLSPERPNRHIYFVVSGQLCVRLTGLQEKPVAAIRPGHCSGEVSILDEQPPSAWVSASEPTELLMLDREQLWQLVNQSHALSRNLLYVMSLRIRSYRQLVTEQTDEANTDSLTGLYNRRWLDDRLPRLLDEGRSNGSPVAALMVDADYFKQFNDRYGHAAGDDALRALAKILKQSLRENDAVVRYGGEEFTVLLPRSDADRAMAVAERIRQAVNSAALNIQGVDSTVRIAVSIGAAVASANKPLAASDLLRQADHALYEAKEAGRNKVVQFSAGES